MNVINTINTPENVVVHPNAPTEYMSVADTAKLIRAALKDAFPRVKFSVKSKSYSGGASITIRWVDGPTTKDVDAVAQQFAGADFDGSIDLKTYHQSVFQGRRVHFGADFVFTDRRTSVEFLRAVASQVCEKYGLPLPTITASNYDGSGYIDRKDDYRLPDSQRSNYTDSINELVRRYVSDAREVTL